MVTEKKTQVPNECDIYAKYLKLGLSSLLGLREHSFEDGVHRVLE